MLRSLPLLLSVSLPAAALPPAPCPQPAETIVHDRGARLRYCVDGGLALYGDLVLGPADHIRQQGIPTLQVSPWQQHQETQQRARPRRQIPLGPGSTTWPLNVVVYQFGQVTPGARRAMLAAMQDIERKTHVRFRERQSERDYVQIVSVPYNGRICGTSYLGRIGGAQRLQIADRCETTTTASHELQHALGFEDRQIRDAPALSERDILQINHLYPPVNLSAQADPILRLSALHLTIDQHGVGHVRGYLRPGARLLRWQWQDASGRALTLKTLQQPSGHRHDFTILPQDFHGKAILTLWVQSAEGLTQQVQMTLQVQPAQPPGLHRAEAMSPAHDPGPGRQLVLRHSHNLCLTAQTSRRPLALTRCEGDAPNQRWVLHQDGRLENAARHQHCLVGTPAASGGMLLLRHCQATNPRHRWYWQDAVLSSQAAPDDRLTAEAGGTLQLYPPRMDEGISQHWDWR
ncbi:hypothetical protein THUN1379_09570 [Paludibacterium sp. THUN1379]|uniref:M12 family metallopeptidase n=1 Tax=Paludibacterium sp. THUN1379 TaxID=3112107 RepID=UPI003088932F|nr:hypothetical protein THUN1379_09570 [Paludibacterium sp. THUN1379]